MSWEPYPLNENQWKQPISLSSVSLHNTSKDSSSTWDCQEDVHLLLFMWERGEIKTQTMRGRLEINSSCVCVCMCAWMWTSYHCGSFRSGVNKVVSIFLMPVFQHHLTALCHNTQCMYKRTPSLHKFPLSCFPVPMILPQHCSLHCKNLETVLYKRSDKVWSSREKKAFELRE